MEEDAIWSCVLPPNHGKLLAYGDSLGVEVSTAWVYLPVGRCAS
jgi:hypothetical protein